MYLFNSKDKKAKIIKQIDLILDGYEIQNMYRTRD